MGGKGGWTRDQVLGGGGAGVRPVDTCEDLAVERDMRLTLEIQPGELRPPSREARSSVPSSQGFSSSMATLQYGTFL